MKPFIFRILYTLRILKLFPQFYFHYEVKKYVKKGDVVIDIGANQGIYTRIFKSRGAEVYAIEPVYIFWYHFNDMDFKHFLPFALGNEIKIIKLKQWRNSSGAYQIDEDGTYKVRQIKGSEAFKDLLKINFIKIDVEGSELPIIEDMAELILKHKPTILIETGQIDKVLSYLSGYKIIKVVDNDYLIGRSY